MKRLLEWDDLSDMRRVCFAEKESYCSFMSGYTRPIRMPDEWTDEEWDEYNNMPKAYRAIKIATRIPVDPWADMDHIVESMLYNENNDWDADDLAKAWEKIKESRDE